MTQLEMQVSTRLRSYREAAGLSQEKTADLTGVAKSSVGKYERGELRVTVEYIAKFCQVVNINPVKLFERKKVELPNVGDNQV